VKKTFLIGDLVWICFGSLVFIGGLKLGFGSFHQPLAGFMPCLAGLLLGGLALIDLCAGLARQWNAEKADKEIWSNIHWGKLFLTLGILIVFTLLFSRLGFMVGTFLLLIVLYRMMEKRRWWITVLASAGTTGLFYLIFKIGLDSQLPSGFLGF
jgi:hypothetical protein